MPPRTQRRMSEYSSSGKLTRENAVAGARRAARRAGLFASGDLAEALGRVVADEGLPRELLTEEEYLALQKLGEFDTKRSSWLKTPVDLPAPAATRLHPRGQKPGHKGSF